MHLQFKLVAKGDYLAMQPDHWDSCLKCHLSICKSSNLKRFSIHLVVKKAGSHCCGLPLKTTEEDKTEAQKVTVRLIAANEISVDAGAEKIFHQNCEASLRWKNNKRTALKAFLNKKKISPCSRPSSARNTTVTQHRVVTRAMCYPLKLLLTDSTGKFKKKNPTGPLWMWQTKCFSNKPSKIFLKSLFQTFSMSSWPDGYMKLNQLWRKFHPACQVIKVMEKSVLLIKGCFHVTGLWLQASI